MNVQGVNRSSPSTTGRAKSVPDAAVFDGVQRGATGTPTVTPQYSPDRSPQAKGYCCCVVGQGFEPW